jgi:hypothetical protein
LISTCGFSALYGLTVSYHGGHGLAAALVVGIIYLVSFLLPERLFRYTITDVGPAVLSQLGRRWIVGVALTLSAGVAAGLMASWGKPVQLGMELYVYSAVAILVFHGLAGMYANHIVYLQVTRQYNSNQLLVVTALLTVLMLVLILYSLAFDFSASREGYFYLRDLLTVTLGLVGFGWHGFLIAHH